MSSPCSSNRRKPCSEQLFAAKNGENWGGLSLSLRQRRPAGDDSSFQRYPNGVTSTDIDTHQGWLIFTLYQIVSKNKPKKNSQSTKHWRLFGSSKLSPLHTWYLTRKKVLPNSAHLSTSVSGRNRTRHSPYIQLSVVPRHLDLSSASPGNDDSLRRSLLLKGFEGCIIVIKISLWTYILKTNRNKFRKIMYTGIAQWGITTC